MDEQQITNLQVEGSSPSRGATKNGERSLMAKCLIVIQVDAGSIPVAHPTSKSFWGMA